MVGGALPAAPSASSRAEVVHARFRDSLLRCLRHGRFLDRFYTRFIGSSAEVAAIFDGRVDMRGLKRKLAATLEILDMHAGREPGSAEYLAYLGRVHGRMGIRTDLYAVWLDSLLWAVARTDPEFGPAVSAAWTEVLGDVVERIKRAAAAQ